MFQTLIKVSMKLKHSSLLELGRNEGIRSPLYPHAKFALIRGVKRGEYRGLLSKVKGKSTSSGIFEIDRGILG